MSNSMLIALENSEDTVPIFLEITVKWVVRQVNITVECDKCHDRVMSI